MKTMKGRIVEIEKHQSRATYIKQASCIIQSVKDEYTERG